VGSERCSSGWHLRGRNASTEHSWGPVPLEKWPGFPMAASATKPEYYDDPWRPGPGATAQPAPAARWRGKAWVWELASCMDRNDTRQPTMPLNRQVESRLMPDVFPFPLFSAGRLAAWLGPTPTPVGRALGGAPAELSAFGRPPPARQWAPATGQRASTPGLAVAERIASASALLSLGSMVWLDGGPALASAFGLPGTPAVASTLAPTLLKYYAWKASGNLAARVQRLRLGRASRPMASPLC